jgi:putative transposase
MLTQKYIRRSAATWGKIIDQYQQSGLSGAQFCRDKQLPYASFCKWRQHAAGPDNVVSASDSPQPDFVELNTWPDAPDRPWRITLKLGNGVELLLSQP